MRLVTAQVPTGPLRISHERITPTYTGPIMMLYFPPGPKHALDISKEEKEARNQSTIVCPPLSSSSQICHRQQHPPRTQ